MLNQKEELEGKNKFTFIKKVCSIRIKNSKTIFLTCKEHKLK